MIEVSGSSKFICNCSTMRHFHNENVTTKHEPIFYRIVIGRFCVYKEISTFLEKSATNATSQVRYGAERGNEGKPQPFRDGKGVTY